MIVENTSNKTVDRHCHKQCECNKNLHTVGLFQVVEWQYYRFVIQQAPLFFRAIFNLCILKTLITRLVQFLHIQHEDSL